MTCIHSLEEYRLISNEEYFARFGEIEAVRRDSDRMGQRDTWAKAGRNQKVRRESKGVSGLDEDTSSLFLHESGE